MPHYDKFTREPDWWAPWEIHYSREQVEWILDHLITLRDGNYPPDPLQSGYTDASIQKTGVNSKAPFITPADIVAEVDRRMLRCGLDWYLIEDYYAKGLDLETIASQHFLEEEDVWNRIRRVIEYAASGPAPRWVSTEKRKGQEYADFIARTYKKSENPKRRIRVS